MAEQFFPPVVSVLGHVDHGKTTLLDAIRKSDVAGGEVGGITQKIGISQIETLYEGESRAITFIDTPGHAAFREMRSQGAQVADVGLLIVSAVDGVMPQTKEALELFQSSRTSFIVVFTKTDLPDRNIDRVKQQLLRENVLLEGYGGDIPSLEVSARTGTNIKELLDLILLVYSLTPHEVDPKAPLKGVVIESKRDTKVGPRATVVVKNGTLSVREDIIVGKTQGRVRSLTDAKGNQIKEVTVGAGVELLGLEDVPEVGSIVTKKGEIPQAASLKKKEQAEQSDKESLLSIILCADTQGSLEAILYELPPEVKVMESRSGEISESDVLLAKSTGSIILTFNVRVKPDVLRFAQVEKVLVKNYQIIYEMLDEVTQVIEGKASALLEHIYGVGTIQAKFPFDKLEVLGLMVNDGRVAKGDKVRVVKPDGTIIGESTISSVRQGKTTVTKVEKGAEAGVILSPQLDTTIGDMLLSHS